MRIAVGLSGGVDSSVAALLLAEAGHGVTGVFMKTRSGPAGPSGRRGGCFGRDEAEDIRAASAVCERLGIELRIIDCARGFEEIVLRDLRAGYLAGTTPNPCVRCNPLVKFGLLPEAARRAGLLFDRFATGHYARIAYDPSLVRFLLKRAADARKDQSYFLYRLGQPQLATALFPLGDLLKAKVREIARKERLPVHDRKESQDFYPGDPADLFGRDALAGDIVDREGRVLGRHRGVWRYTVGQRKGLGIAHPVPLYVLGIDAAANRLVVGPESETHRRSVVVGDTVWGPFEALAAPAEVRVKLRSTGRLVRATVSPLEEGRARIDLAEPVSSAAPGQSAVLYDGDTVLGGGVIVSAA
ncbi:MAG TPA: tRNA 2-thiouridine(34) synthase MnmA [Candidatus Aminicenantes bacterium]|nr:tRNA 2-thiouridine(34) synthase MnmA [Candidatus Aminicenantes bacterium]